MLIATAQFPYLRFTHSNIQSVCPTTALLNIIMRGYMRKNLLRSVCGSKNIQRYLKSLCNTETAITTYSMRFGGRTWLITQGMDCQFVDILGTWKSPKASARYYRENPDEVLRVTTKIFAGPEPLRDVSKRDGICFVEYRFCLFVYMVFSLLEKLIL